MDKSQSNFSVLVSLEHSIKDLFREIDTTRQMAVDNAEHAARLAARESTREILENLPQAATLPQMDQLSRSIQDMFQSQEAVDQRAQATLNAVHAVLEKMTGRLVAIEEDLAEVKEQPVAPKRPEAAWVPVEPKISQPSAPERLKMPVAEPAHFIEPQRSREWAQPPVAQDFSVSRDASQDAGAFEEDFLLEPRSSARATHASPHVTFDSPSVDGAASQSSLSPSTKTEFIAAARRAAQAASQSTQVQLDEASGAAQKDDQAGTPRALLERARTFAERRKRPLLLGLAAMMIAVLGVQLVRTVGQHEVDSAVKTSSTQQQPAKPMDTAAPASDSVAPKPFQKSEPSAPPQAMASPAPMVPAEPSTQAPPVSAPPKNAPLTNPIFKDMTRAPSALNNPLGQPSNFVKGVMALNTRGFVMTRPMPGKKPNAVDLTPLATMQAQNPHDVVDAAVPSPSAQTQAQAASTSFQQPATAPSAFPQATALVAPDVDRTIAAPTNLTSPIQPQIPVNPDAASPTSAGLKVAAQGGNPAAQYELATRFLDGRGETRDFKAAATLLEKAANQGLAPAQYRLGALYEKGLGVPRDLAQAKTLYERSAKSGNPRAMHNLAVLTAEGATGSPDYAGAVNWFRRAAEYGIRDSQFNLAVLYARGLGVSQDLSQSYIWFSLAAAQGDEDAGRKRDDVASKMDTAKLEAAKASVSAFRNKIADPAAVEVSPPVGGWDSLVPKAENHNFTNMPPRKAS